MNTRGLNDCGNPDCHKVHCDLCGDHLQFKKQRTTCTQCGKRSCYYCTCRDHNGYTICHECDEQATEEFIARHDTRKNDQQEAFSVLGCRVYGIPMLGRERIHAQALASGK